MQKKIVFITGVHSGLGKALFSKFSLSPKYNCIGHVRNKQQANELLRENSLNTNQIFIADFKNIHVLETKLIQKKFQIDILINNVGYYSAHSFFDYSAKKIISQISINFLSSLLLIHYFSKHMKKNNYGRIINISSGSGNHGGLLPSFPYALSKNAINYMTQILPKEFEKYNIRINTFSPRFINTKMLVKFRKSYKKMLRKESLVQYKIYEPDEIASIIYAAIGKDNLKNGEIIELR